MKTFSVRVVRTTTQVDEAWIEVRAPDEDLACELAQDLAERGEVEWVESGENEEYSVSDAEEVGE